MVKLSVLISMRCWDRTFSWSIPWGKLLRRRLKRYLANIIITRQSVKKSGPEPTDPHPERKQTYHYLPYRFDSGLEREFFKDSVLPILGEYKSQLEIYFNGDDTLTDFKIDCYKQSGREWRYIGKYVPDFLLLKRNDDGSIHQIIIIETKGEGFAAKFADRRQFMETEFIRKNNECFGYERFRFLYLEDTLTKEEREKKTIKAIKDFFNI